MRTYEFQDIDQQQVRVQYSGSGNIRIYLEKDNKESGHLHLTLRQAVILAEAMTELVEMGDNNPPPRGVG